MCGLTGIAGDGINTPDMEALLDLIAISTLRGQDGTGVAQGRFFDPEDKKKNTFLLHKDAYESNYFLWYHKNDKGANKLLFNIFDNVHAYHVRWATKGAVNQDNCHPFEVANLIGMHNGTLKEPKYQHSTKTDSEILFEEIAKDGHAEVLSSLREDSAYAVVTLDTTTGVLTFARNKHRPLFAAFGSERDVLFWHSEQGALEYILGRHGIKHHGIVCLEPKKLYTMKPWDIDEKNPGFSLVEELPVKPVVFTPGAYLSKDQQEAMSDEEYKAWWDQYDTWESNLGWGGAYGTHGASSYYDGSSWRPRKVETVDVHDVKSLTYYPPKKPTTNIVDFSRRKSARIPHFECIGCSRSLNLVDQHHACHTTTQEGVRLFECEDCVKTRIEMKVLADHPTTH